MKVRGRRLGQTLIALETALTCSLAIVAGLLLHSFFNVLHVDKGFTAERVLAVDLSLPRRSYTMAQGDQFYEELLERMRAVPGVHSAGAVNVLPLVSESVTRLIRLEGDADYRHDVERPVAVYRVTTPGYFATIGVPLQTGRFFEESEAQPVAVISAGLARRFWPMEPLSSVVGRRIRPGDLDSPLVTIVGIVGDVHSGALDREPMPAIYRPQRRSGWLDLTLVARTSGDPIVLGTAIRAEIKRLDDTLPISAMRNPGRYRLGVRGNPSLPDHVGVTVCRSGANAGGSWCLWSDKLRSDPSNPRDRRANRPRCDTRTGPQFGSHARTSPPLWLAVCRQGGQLESIQCRHSALNDLAVTAKVDGLKKTN
jgi:hypothetical protein